MLHKLESTGVEHQGVAGDAGFGLVGFRETAIDYHHFSIGFDRAFSLYGLHGHMSVDNVPVLTGDAKLIEQHVAHGFVVAQSVVISLHLLVGGFILEEVALKCSHLVLVESGRILAAPQIPHIVDSKLVSLLIFSAEVGIANDAAGLVKQFLALIFLAADSYLL